MGDQEVAGPGRPADRSPTVQPATPGAGSGASPGRQVPRLASTLGLIERARHGPWRVVVAEASMRPALEPGDWLLVDPTIRIWPRRGTIVVVREPDTEVLAVKRVAARPGDVIRTMNGPIRLAPDQAWLLGDDRLVSIDSRRYGPVGLDRLVGRAWYRYGPRDRIGRLEERAPGRGRS